LSYDIINKNHGITINFSGILSKSDLDEVNHKIITAPDFENTQYIIWDASRIDSFNIDDHDATKFSAMDSVTSKHNSKRPLKLAFFSTDDRINELIDIYIENTVAMGNKWLIKSFNNLSIAKEWALLDDDSL